MSWINLQMMLQDLVWFDYDAEKEDEVIDADKLSKEELKEKFGKYSKNYKK